MKNILIVGASGGIGSKLLKKVLENKNFNIYALVRKEKSLYKIKCDNLHPIYLDLEDKSFKQKLEKSLSKIKNINYCIINSGFLLKSDFLNLNEVDIIKSYQINAFAPLYISQILVPKMIEKGGHIVHISTMGAIQGSVKFSGLTAYSSSKSVVCNLTEMFAEEYKDTKIKMNCLCLGAVNTEMLQKAFPGYEAQIKSDEMADFILNFTFNNYKFMNGKLIPVSLSTP